MRSIIGLAAAAAMVGGGMGGHGIEMGQGSMSLPLGIVEPLNERQQRNADAGGRGKRIKRDKARKSFLPRRKVQTSRQPSSNGMVFKSAKREAVFRAGLNKGLDRNEALKFARRVAA